MHKKPHKIAGNLGHQIRKLLRPWHRRLGIIGAIFLLLLTLTGVAINHSADLKLAKTPVSQSWLLDYYGIQTPSHAAGFGRLYITDNLLWQANILLLEADAPLIAAVTRGEQIIASDGGKLYLLSLDGKLLETQDASLGLPIPIVAMTLTNENELWLKTPDNSYLADDELIDWQEKPLPATLSWQQAEAVDPALIDHARSANLSWERVILDLHSGRLFGAWAVWLWDLIALIFIMLSLSGLYLWQSQRKRKG